MKAIRLPGHASKIEDLGRVKYRDWIIALESALREPGKEYAKVFVFGLSMGALLAVRLAETHPEISASAFLAPALAYIKSKTVYLAKFLLPFMKYLKNDYRDVFRAITPIF